MRQTIIVIGTNSSGSSAISDYLSSRKDLFNPFGTNEFIVCTDPTGLHYLFNNCYLIKKNLFYPSHVFEEYKKYIINLEKYIVYSNDGKEKKLYNKKIISITNKFLKDVTQFKYYALPHYKAVNLNFTEKMSKKINRKLFNKNIPEMKILPVILPVKKEKFIQLSRKYIDKLIQASCKKKLNNLRLVINNGADTTDPINSSEYYYNRKIICVTRDPRDIFSGMKMRQAGAVPWYDVKAFINWYKYFFANPEFQKILKHKLILHVKFEDFINSFDCQNKKICEFIGISKNISFRNGKEKIFDLNFSKKNIYKSKKNLSKYEFNLIEKKLKNYLQW